MNDFLGTEAVAYLRIKDKSTRLQWYLMQLEGKLCN